MQPTGLSWQCSAKYEREFERDHPQIDNHLPAAYAPMYVHNALTTINESCREGIIVIPSAVHVGARESANAVLPVNRGTRRDS